MVDPRRRALIAALLAAACAPSVDDGPPVPGGPVDTALADPADAPHCGLPLAEGPSPWVAFVEDAVAGALARWEPQGLCFERVALHDAAWPAAAYEVETGTLWVTRDDHDAEAVRQAVQRASVEAIAIEAGLVDPWEDPRWPGPPTTDDEREVREAFPWMPHLELLGAYGLADDRHRQAVHALALACGEAHGVPAAWSAQLDRLDALLGLPAVAPLDWVPLASVFTEEGAVVLPDTAGPEAVDRRAVGIADRYYLLQWRDPEATRHVGVDLATGALDPDWASAPPPREQAPLLSVGPSTRDGLDDAATYLRPDGTRIGLVGLRGLDPGPRALGVEADDGTLSWVDHCPASDLAGYDGAESLVPLRKVLWQVEGAATSFVRLDGDRLRWFRAR